MDQTNRVLIVGAALLWIFALLVIILLAWGSPDESIEQLADLAGYLEDHNDTDPDADRRKFTASQPVPEQDAQKQEPHGRWNDPYSHARILTTLPVRVANYSGRRTIGGCTGSGDVFS